MQSQQRLHLQAFRREPRRCVVLGMGAWATNKCERSNALFVEFLQMQRLGTES
jgi:hypothetical protein